jgi:hypothetical protein
LEFDAGEPDEPDESLVETGEETRLVTGVQGLLAPIRIATNIGDDDPVAPRLALAPGVAPLPAEQLRIIRALMGEAPPVAPIPAVARRTASVRVSWVFWLLAAAVGLPALLRLGGPDGIPHQWPGVTDGYAAIQSLTPESLVVVYWAYDPATAGEMDLVMQPVVRHLFMRQARLAVVSPLPGGPATAARLIEQARTGPAPTGATEPASFTFLPGGAAVLPLLARDPAAALLEEPAAVERESARRIIERLPALVVVAAAHAEDVQDWLEQVQPLERTPVVAVTGAGADPILRSYWDSGQLRGLVSGFDGAYAYEQLLEPFAARASPPPLARQIILQNWGQLALIAIIALGNVAALFSRSGGD